MQPLEGWRELWMFRASPQGWTVQVLPPSTQGPGIGYIEFAGWVPGTGEVLAAREVRDPQHAARTLRSFELLDGRTLDTERAADASIDPPGCDACSALKTRNLPSGVHTGLHACRPGTSPLPNVTARSSLRSSAEVNTFWYPSGVSRLYARRPAAFDHS